MRADANISVAGGSRVEIKNIGSPKDVEKALAYEIVRQKQAISKGVTVKSETRHWDDLRKVTVPLRVKEEEQDYRYFPEADIPPIVVTRDYIEKIRKSMPELPDVRAKRFVKEYGLTEYEAQVLVMSKWLADFFEEALKYYSGKPRKLANILINDFLRWIHEKELEPSSIKAKPQHIAELLKLLDEKVISIKILKNILPEIIVQGKSPRKIILERDLVRISDRETIKKIVLEVFMEHKKSVHDALVNEKAVHYLIGQVMRKTRGKADPELTHEMVLEMLEKVRKGELKI